MEPGSSMAVSGGPKQLVLGNGEAGFPCHSEANWGAEGHGLRKPFTVEERPPSVKNRGVLGVEHISTCTS
jgi:hypothetical protein